MQRFKGRKRPEAESF